MQEHKEFPIGVSDFEKLIRGNYHFVDKTLLIREIMNDGSEVIVLPRPRRFGKTLNLSMLHYFLSKSYYSDEANQDLFEGLNISKDTEFCKKHQGQYPVIFISFKDIKVSEYDKAYADIVVLISQLYAQHRYLLEGDLLEKDEKEKFLALLNQEASEANVKASIKQLALYTARKFKQWTIILIDEYDTPIQEGYLNKYYDKIVDLMRGLLGQTLKDNIPEERYLEKAIITGITRVSQESLFSGINNLEIYSILQEKYGQYFGFTEEEVLQLMKDSQQTIAISLIKEWYNGYQVGKYVLYNPWSIIKCFKNNGDLQPYWVNTSSSGLIAELLEDAQPIIKQQFEELLQGNVIEQPISENLVFANIKTSPEALWSLLLYAGYLKVLSRELRGRRLMTKLAIPNKEVCFVYDKIFEQWFSDVTSLNSYDKFVESLANGNIDQFKNYLSEYIMQTSSYFEFNSKTSEKTFHVFILGLVVGLREHYHIHSNKESGFGRFDVIFIPKDKNRNGILLEFKTGTSVELLLNKAKEALEQVKDKKYIEIFKQHNVSSVLAIGLAFFGKAMELVHENISIK